MKKVIKILVTDIDIDFNIRPNSDVYQCLHEDSIVVELTVPDNVTEEELKELISTYLKYNLPINFDTPDEPYYEIEDIYFEHSILED